MLFRSHRCFDVPGKSDFVLLKPGRHLIFLTALSSEREDGAALKLVADVLASLLSRKLLANSCKLKFVRLVNNGSFIEGVGGCIVDSILKAVVDCCLCECSVGL